MRIRKATMDDLTTIVEILEDGRNQLAERGIDQWQGDYPNVTQVKEDIEKGVSYLVKADDDETVGVLAIVNAPDHIYDEIDGQWLLKTDHYVTIHRVAIHSKHAGKGYASKLFVHTIDHIKAQRPEVKSIRLSTNENNLAMQRVITKNGFKQVGTMKGVYRPQERSYVYELLTEMSATRK